MTNNSKARTDDAAFAGDEARNDTLRRQILKQWQAETLLRLGEYTLPVPFSEMPFGQYEGQAIPTMQSWQVILPGVEEAERPDLNGTFEQVAASFQHPNMPRRLVVLGDPGSGKTVVAQSLTVLLLGGTITVQTNRSAAASAARPGRGANLIPVLLQLSTWNPQDAFEDWAEVQMIRGVTGVADVVGTDEHGHAITRARELIENHQVLMVLDGLDEVGEAHRAEAFARLAEAAGVDRPMVITCRTREYVKLVAEAGMPMPKTPVIRLEPLDVDAVVGYLESAGEDQKKRFAPLTKELAARPYGELARALSSPFRLWLAGAVYRNRTRDPAELLDQETVRDVEQRLLTGLVEAIYRTRIGRHPERRDGARVATVREQLTDLAGWLVRTQRQEIDWWVLPERPPRWFVGGVIGGLVGLLLGAAAGYAAAIKFDPRFGLILGIATAVAAGILAGITACRPQEYPRTVDLHFEWSFKKFAGCLLVGIAVAATTAYADVVHGGWIAAAVTAAIVGPAAAGPCMRAFGDVQGATAGITAALALGLSSGLSVGKGHPVGYGLLAGLTFVGAAWIFVGLFQESTENFQISPDSLFARDRRGSLVVALTAGVAFAVIYGIALGPAVGAIAFVGLAVTVSLTVSMWGAFTVSRFWFAARGQFPLRLMGFLREAYDRGVLRQAGGSYQFRHAKLRNALVGEAAAPDPASDADDYQAPNLDLA